MARSIRTFLPVVGEPAVLAKAFEGDPSRWLPAARQEGPDRWRFVAHAGTLSRPVIASVGSPWRAGRARWRSLAWEPIDAGDGAPATLDRFLPSLDGELGIHLRRGGPATLMLDARYDPPGGALGAAVDAVALSRVARGTVERFLADVVARLSAEAVLLGPVTPPKPESPTGDLPHHDRTGAVRT